MHGVPTIAVFFGWCETHKFRKNPTPNPFSAARSDSTPPPERQGGALMALDVRVFEGGREAFDGDGEVVVCAVWWGGSVDVGVYPLDGAEPFFDVFGL